LGRGSNGIVRLATKITDGSICAMKIPHSRIEKGASTALAREAAVVAGLVHRNVVKMVDTVMHEGKICIVFEYERCGSLHNYIHRYGRRGDSHARQMARDLAAGVRYLHQQGIAHRDVKPQNVILADVWPAHLKICDLGSAAQVGTRGMMKGVVGTAGYMAPEMVDDSEYTMVVDEWSMG
ncbi:kinase-like protein, partial [Auricularia subglabra TFB-10046 SS5]